MEKAEDPTEDITRQLQLSLLNLTKALTMANGELTEMTRALVPASVSKREIALLFLDTDTRTATYGDLDKTLAQMINSSDVEVKRYAWKLGEHPISSALVIFVTSGSSPTELDMVVSDKNVQSDMDILGIITARHGVSTPLLLSSREPDARPLSSLLLPGSQRSVPVWQIRYTTKRGVMTNNTVTKNSLARIKHIIMQKLTGVELSPPRIVQNEVALVFFDDVDSRGNLAEILATSLRGYDAAVETYLYPWGPDEKPKSESFVIFVISIQVENASQIVADTILYDLPEAAHVLGIIVPIHGRESALLSRKPRQPESGVMTSIVLVLPNSRITVPLWQIRYEAQHVLVDDGETNKALTRIKNAVRRQF